ncbi:transcriptional regulator [Psychrobacillus vulpis]|uniref:Transcriptional regulator n=1 Tax=Psychrobacillus vulpis TaxID=2325572 RepID=A0A544TK78_9BACI|nr:transcriptional regulator [Psychrobacillus vulpis]TQR17829.1 transcriptional regulator [Psychrobacillus vulpis]
MNVKIRKDSWTSEEDNLLKELVLKKIEQGHTQISGFQEASILLGRSKQACAFRWNKNLRPIVLKKEGSVREVHSREVPDSSSLQNHLQLAMESYDEMKQSYDQISDAYNLLKRDYEQLVNWVRQGITHIDHR